MGKSLFIAEKPSVAKEFAKALKINGSGSGGYIESKDYVVTWCVGHLVSMSYPEKYDEALKKWRMDTLPFVPKEYKYEVIDGVKKQFDIVKSLLTRQDVDTIYVCTDSGREGEYIYRLVEQEAHVEGKGRRRVWIDSQTEEEIIRGIKEAKDLAEYDNLSDSAYCRAKEDYLMGINFSRVLSLKYGNSIAGYLGLKFASISVGRVMTCVLGMVVKREREIRAFVKTPFYRVIDKASLLDEGKGNIEFEWKAAEKSGYFNSPLLYKENGFKEEKDAKMLIGAIGKAACEKEGDAAVPKGKVVALEKKKEKKNPPLLFNLAELQNECSKLFKISPAQTLEIVQELYEKKLVTYPRTDARVLSTAISKEIHKNISGLRNFSKLSAFASEIMEKGSYKGIEKTKYVNDKLITDHYAIIPTGQGIGGFDKLRSEAQKVYELIARRFLSIFYPAAVYNKVNMTLEFDALFEVENGDKKESVESFFASSKVLFEEGYLKVASVKKTGGVDGTSAKDGDGEADDNGADDQPSSENDAKLGELVKNLKKGDLIEFNEFSIKEGETSPPKRYNSGSIILAMENAGQLIEDESLREQIKGSGIGTSATRAEILKKLVNIKYLALNNKTQIITPTQMGEMVHDVVAFSIKQLLNPELTASWEKGLTYVAEGTISGDEYMGKLEDFVKRRVDNVKTKPIVNLKKYFDYAAQFYK